MNYLYQKHTPLTDFVSVTTILLWLTSSLSQLYSFDWLYLFIMTILLKFIEFIFITTALLLLTLFPSQLCFFRWLYLYDNHTPLSMLSQLYSFNWLNIFLTTITFHWLYLHHNYCTIYSFTFVFITTILLPQNLS